MAVAQHLRAADIRAGGGHTAAADLVLLFAATQHWFVSERRYRGHESAPVRLNHADLFLDRTATTKRQVIMIHPIWYTSALNYQMFM